MKLELKVNSKHIPVMIADGMQIKNGPIEVFVRVDKNEFHIGNITIFLNEGFGIFEAELLEPVDGEIENLQPMYWYNTNDGQSYINSIILFLKPKEL